jgi:phosphoserine phosphatase
MAKKKPTVALIYDFDGTLSPGNMQEFDFLKAIGIKNKNAFWKENNELIKRHEASNILCYMKLMLDKAHAAKVSVKKQNFIDFGKSIELYNGVEEWFDLINQLGKEEGVTIQHYINSSGLKEMIEGTTIAKKFKEIYACYFMYEDDVAVWPAVAVDFTAKTQFLFMINKGISKISENAKVNEFKAEDERPVPFKHMIYFGDGETDIPCMKLIKQQGGNSIAVYKPKNQKKKKCAEKLVQENRVNFACPADYSKGSDIYNIV